MSDVEKPGILGAHHEDASETSLSTLPDPRTASSSDLSRTGSNASRHPDLSAEVAALSDKLITAINHQTTLDDTLAHTRHELEASRARIRQLEAESREYEEKIANGELLTKDKVENAKGRLAADLAEERKLNTKIKDEKRGIEQELETLTASLFEEANKMVAAANREKDAIQKKNQQLRDQIKDTEMLLTSQQEQLTELKVVMQQMSTDRDDQDSVKASTAPSSPGFHKEDTMTRLMEVMNLTPTTPADGDISPAPSTSFTHLMKPICRTDLPAYDEFRSLISIAQSQPASRVTSGTYGGLNVMGLAGLTNGHNGSSPTVNVASPPAGTNSPTTPGSYVSTPTTSKEPIPLRETKFYKRVLTEDVEPTLRLDIAPGISWLTRRSLLTAICDGSLIVEPIPDASRKLYGRYTTCSTCGENRKSEENPRTHRMRTSDSEGANRYQLCHLCLEKVRATCDLVGFVRMIKDGVVRIREGDAEAEQEAWEELVRLRERMFWARMAAGVVPAFMERSSKSGKASPTVDSGSPRTEEGVFRRSSSKKISIGGSIIKQATSATTIPSPLQSSEQIDDLPDTPEEENAAVERQLHASLEKSVEDGEGGEMKEKENEILSPPPVPERSSQRDGSTNRINGTRIGSQEGQSLKVAIPGGFE